MLSTDSATRAALRSVGRPAATVDDTIHLDPVAVTTQRMTEVLAHELTHIAEPSPVARFFDDPHDSPEERRAEAVAATIARAPTPPSASLVGHRRTQPVGRTATTGGPAAADVVRRALTTSGPSSAPAGGGSASAGTISADDLVSQITGSTPSSPATIHRKVSSGSPASNSGTEMSIMPEQRRGEDEFGVGAERLDDREFQKAFVRNLDTIVRILQDRMQRDIDQRTMNRDMITTVRRGATV
jgi:hypothetical protein